MGATVSLNEQEQKEVDCYNYCLKIAKKHFKNGEISKAIAYHENIIRSLKEINRIKESKKLHDQAWLLLKQIESDKQHKELLYRMKVNIYE